MTIEDVKAFDATDSFDNVRVKKATKLLAGLTKGSVGKKSAASVSIYMMVAKKLGLETTEPKEETASEPAPVAKPQQLYRSPIKSVIKAAVIQNIKSLAKPPVDVLTVLRAWFLILGYGDCTWADCKKQLGDHNLAKVVSEFNPTSARPADVKKSKRVLRANSKSTQMFDASLNGLSSIAEWVS